KNLLFFWSYNISLMLIVIIINILKINIKENNSLIGTINQRIPGILYQMEKRENKLKISYFSDKIKDLFEIQGKKINSSEEFLIQNIHPEEREILQEMILISANNLEPFRLEVRTNSRNPKWIQIDGVPEMKDENLVVWNGYILDVTRRKTSEFLMRESEEKLREFIQFSPIGIALIKINGKILNTNKACKDILNITSRDIYEKSFWEIIDIDEKNLNENIFSKVYSNNGFLPIEKSVILNNGKKIFIKFRGLLVEKDGEDESLWVLVENITALKENQEKLEFIALYDTLTGLPNRRSFSNKLNELLLNSKTQKNLFAVCYLDLDDFKPFNDDFGHEIGNKLLSLVAERLKTIISGDDLLSRFGGDEFVILFNNLNNKEQGIEKINRLLKLVSEPFTINDNLKHSINTSVGVTFFPDDNSDVDSLIRHVDQALYLSKQQGKNTYHIFDPNTEKNFKEKTAKYIKIKQAFEENEFQLYFQPIVDLKTRKIVGAEALIRWINKDGEIFLPLDFLPIIENTDLTIPIGEWIVKEAINNIRFLKTSGYNISVSVNVFSKHLQSSKFFDFIIETLSSNKDIPPERLRLEILETTAMEDMEHICSILQNCKNEGVEVVLDDFGTAYSSLTYLKKIPTGIIKIDQSFVRHMLNNKEDMVIVKSIVSLAKEFHKKVVAEGIETEEQIEELIEIGCHLGQGYLFSKPISKLDFLELLKVNS
ncbi:MAG: EAL domain-containing protein, partial [Leptospiraceae bacterium]|nr:EAL domain-containing protein [Leptospiraceae bacterium]